MRGRIWNGTHKFNIEIVLLGVRFGGVCLSVLSGGIATALMIGLFIPGLPGVIPAVLIALVTLALTGRVAFWFHQVDRQHTIAEHVILGALVEGARNRTWTNLDPMLED
ncbi:hypothetical protein [Mycobacteroides abscessus]|uniref:hypothetical protein n=1 Tax=Mycobacteroides abscessus TaxID=36809 RepID=UPI000C26446D|nr:hypothetical protein [Mycobacteroides abscessus]